MILHTLEVGNQPTHNRAKNEFFHYESGQGEWHAEDACSFEDKGEKMKNFF